jgi:cytochrome c biogenesis protein ResB
MRQGSLKTKKIWRFFCSIKLALTLLTLIVLASIIGTLIPQDLTYQEYVQKYGKALYQLFAKLNLFDIYHSWWFILFLSLLGLNLLICSLDRLRISRRSFGLIITHFSLIIILLGALISALFSQKGFIGLYEGQTKDVFFIRDQPHKLNFKLSLEDFDIQWYEPQTHQLTIYLVDKNREQTYSARLGEEYRIEGSDYSFVVLQYIPDFFIDQAGNFNSKSKRPNNPALLIQVNHPSGSEKRWVFSKFHSPPFAKDKNIKFAYDFREMIKDFQSHVKVIDRGRVVLRKVIRVNYPLKYKGYTFYQSNYNPEELDWTGLQVVKDPGVGWVFTGFIFLNIGLVITYYMKLRSRHKEG